jgi:NADPH-dependent curcumin reductase CurA
MNETTNRQWVLAERPKGPIEDRNFRWVQGPVPALDADGQVLVRTLYLSVDPTQRGWISYDTYLPAVPIGDVVRSVGVGRVEKSRHPDFAPGDVVSGMLGWQDYAVLPGKGPGAPQKVIPGVPIPLAMSALVSRAAAPSASRAAKTSATGW